MGTLRERLAAVRERITRAAERARRDPAEITLLAVTELFQVIQTVDSPKLARRLNDAGRALDVMLEVKLSEEDAKSGADPAALAELIDAVGGCGNLRLLGLMSMPPWTEDAEASRPYFRRLRELAEQYGLRQLSMGMSHDLEAAIEEGATCVRVGTALFGKRKA